MATSVSTIESLRTPVKAAPARSLAESAGRRDLELSFDDTPQPAAIRKNRVPKGEIADMTAQLAIMTQSGLDLSSALSSLANQCERPALAAVLRDINELVHS